MCRYPSGRNHRVTKLRAPDITATSLEAKGKTERGDNQSNGEDDLDDEDDDDEGPETDKSTTSGDEHAHQAMEIDVLYEDDEGAYPQFVSIATSQIALQRTDESGADIPEPGDVLADGYMWTGKQAKKDMEEAMRIHRH